MNCLDGYFCGDDDTCVQNICDENMVDCPRGVCDATTGVCVNAENCAALDECRDGFVCVQGACTALEDSCEDCPGNQECEYDEPSLDVACVESANGCGSTIDCIGDRICRGGSCQQPPPCVPDQYEPNDTRGSLTSWSDNANDGRIQATLCEADTDFFAFDSRDADLSTGMLVVEVVLDAVDIGGGGLTIDIYDDTGVVLASGTNTGDQQRARAVQRVGNLDQGVYQIGVSAASDIGSGGVGYTVYMDIVPESTSEICSVYLPLTGADMGDTSRSLSNSLGSTCVFDSVGTEEAWQFDVTQTSYATISVNSTFDAAISLREQCESDESELSCVNDQSGSGAESIARRLEPGSYIVLVEGTGGSEQGTYTIDLDLQPVSCGAADVLCVDASTSQFCNPQGTGVETRTCANGCDSNTGRCIGTEGDSCAAAVDATAGFSGSLSMGSYAPDYDPGETCVPEGTYAGSVTEGNDAVFKVTLQTNDVVYATVSAPNFNIYHGMYLVDDCANVGQSCLEGVNDRDFSGDETLVWENTGAAGDFFLIIDSELAGTGTLDVEILTGARICTPGEQQCNGTFLETCNVAGTAWDQRTCSFGCDAQTLLCVAPPNDQCSGAIDVSAGGQWTGTIDDYYPDYNNTRACTGYTSSGADGVYVVSGNAGDIVKATVAAPFDVALYAAEDCDQLAFSCLVGDDNGGRGTTEEIEFRLASTDPVYIVVDTISSSSSGDFTLDVTVSAPTCSNNEQAISCLADGTTLEVCNALGRTEDYACATTCAGGVCDAPTGDRCFDAITLFDGSVYNGSFGDVEADYDLRPGTCILSSSDRQRGNDTVFAVDLAAGDLLTATLDTVTSSAGMYVVTDCGDVTGTCLHAEPRDDEFEFYAATTGRYFLIVDSTSTFTSSDFELTVDIQPGFVCQPGGVSCNTTSGVLTFCNDDGTATTGTQNCTTGCRASGQCNPPAQAADTCMNAGVINGSTVILDSFSRFSPDLDPGATSGNSCGLSDTDGPEAVYMIQLQANEVLDVTVDDLGGSASVRAYIVSDCNAPETSCLDSDSDTAVARTVHIAPSVQTVYLVVDSSTPTAQDPFVLDIDIRPSECAPTLLQCTSATTGERCTRFGQIETYDCFFGCTAGVCDPPTNDSCTMPYDVTAGGIYTIDIADYTDDYDPGINGCTDYYADGADAVFKATLAQDQLVEVKARADGFDVGVYVTTTCGDVNTCIAGADVSFSDEEGVLFAAPAAGDYFIYVDTSSFSPTGTFDLEVNFPTPICTPNEAVCNAGGTAITACDSLGLSQEDFLCDASGCTGTASTCNNADGEICFAAIDASAGGSFTGTFADFEDDYDLGSTSCTGYSTDGPDAVYFVELMAGEQVTATLTAATADTALYISSSCADVAASCLVGDDAFGSGETVTYTATAGERVYIFADNYDTTVSEMFTLDVTIQ